MIFLWLPVGLLVGLVIWLTQRKSVMRISPDDIPAAKRRVLIGAVLRWVLSAVMLAAALQEGWLSGLAAFLGLMAARWVGIVSLRIFPIREKQDYQRI